MARLSRIITKERIQQAVLDILDEQSFNVLNLSDENSDEKFAENVASEILLVLSESDEEDISDVSLEVDEDEED